MRIANLLSPAGWKVVVLFGTVFSVAGKVTVGLASHRICVTDSVLTAVYANAGLVPARER